MKADSNDIERRDKVDKAEILEERGLARLDEAATYCMTLVARKAEILTTTRHR
jgi:hypothetical protein